jgi:hydrogenase maturation protein HypF
LLDAQGQFVAAEDPLALFVARIREGEIGALKGLGGFHLTCAANHDSAVTLLRRRKQRDEKPFAVMVGDLNAAKQLARISADEERLLASPKRPIVLLHKRSRNCLAEGVAPRNPFVGVMLPYTPVHHLLMQAVGSIPLVMTSGNLSDEPIAYENDDALTRLSGIADIFLMHDRSIYVRCDDAVTRIVNGAESLVRRSRGYAPQPIGLPFDCPYPILAVGGQLKGTFALGRGRYAFVSHHLGDLDHYAAFLAFERDILLYQQLLAVEPVHIAHDIHPDYASTGYARRRTPSSKHIRSGKPFLIAVQHHHAHMASCMAEHGLDVPVIGVTFDGTGYGHDGAVWGGEFLVGDYRGFRRAAHLRYVGMPGGEQAIREPWRMALAHLRDADDSMPEVFAELPRMAVRAVEKMLQSGFNTPVTSSAGRLFDAVAAIAGVRWRVSYEGQAAIELEWRATEVTDGLTYPFAIEQTTADESQEPPLIVDTRPLIHALAVDAAECVPAAIIGRRFHNTMVEMITAVCDHIRNKTHIDTIVLSGGVFMNSLLSSEADVRLRKNGFRVCRHRLVPPNDGGLCLGQLAIAAAFSGGA